MLQWEAFVSVGISEFFTVSQRAEISETGGGHNQKGIEFQKNWALIKMLEMESNNSEDFLFLFEAVQDIAILDSEIDPKKIKLFQLKKKDRGEWSWSGLSCLSKPEDPQKKKKSKRKSIPLESIKSSPIGKLYNAVDAFKTMSSEGRFVSNSGCDLLMKDGSNAATSTMVSLDMLPTEFSDLLVKALQSFDPNGSLPDTSKLYIEKVSIPVDDPVPYSIGKACEFLRNRSPLHAGQAQSFVESLLIKITPLGARTETCRNFEEMRYRHGFGRKNFQAALNSLEKIIDPTPYYDSWLNQLQKEGFNLIEITAIRIALTEISRRKLSGTNLKEDIEIEMEVKKLLPVNPIPPILQPWLETLTASLAEMFPHEKKAKLRAYILCGAIEQCVDLT
ncbi:DUF4297 domain-containing protein [Novacetimonas hansenii]|uniref:dsDNA nuclease domain-containing protein n=1 Tax=Novacetimonas hansenii TaxID=436 RepID=UPI0009B69373|nr:dsDNA nuclease domain-containing protein [Novacetimonas hansenii]